MVPQGAQSKRSKFNTLFWLVILFEFFERGAYYGMMSFISVYFVNVLQFPKENVGIIKGVIQPLLYFLPILSGALADRFGYRKLLMVAFSLLGGGYFLTSQASSYGGVFAALVIMGFGAGIFKPLISGTIARVTDKSNSTLGFGIYYWSINIGAFLFPLFLVPFLKALNPRYVIIASAICTATMIIPTLLFYKDPERLDKIQKREKPGLIQTIANAFEIIYSPIVLLYYQMKKSVIRMFIITVLLSLVLIYALSQFVQVKPVTASYSSIGIQKGRTVLIFEVKRNMLGPDNYKLKVSDDSSTVFLTVYKPALVSQFSNELLKQCQSFPGFESTDESDLDRWIKRSDQKVTIALIKEGIDDTSFRVKKTDTGHFQITVNSSRVFQSYQNILIKTIHAYPILRGITEDDIQKLYRASRERSFFLLFVTGLILAGLVLFSIKDRKKKEKSSGIVPFYGVFLICASFWIIPGLSMLGRILSTVIFLTLSSLLKFDTSSRERFTDHAKFLLMIFLYSGFWVLYFQMFDSVLWYVQAYVDATSLNNAVNGFLGRLGFKTKWFFDVEHVTVINAGTIILLQLLISNIVRKTRALPTMMVGIALGTLGMAILALNTTIWIFVAGITIFSLGEMTAHPKFISYIGLVAPKENKAMYMGYLFLYGVFGSSIGGIVGARLYVKFVDQMNMPRTLWLIFAGIGVATIIALALYNRFLKPHSGEGNSS